MKMWQIGYVEDFRKQNVKIISHEDLFLNPQAPFAQKLQMNWFFDVSKVKESIFLNRTSLTPSDAHPLENTDFSPSRFHFS